MKLPRIKIGRPQRLAALLLLFFMAECLWVVSHQRLSQQDYRYAECGREMWERPSPLAGYWPMYEGKGQVVHDISGNHNDGRLGSSRSTDGRDADWVTGLYGVGDAQRFDGNDYISNPDAKS